MKKKKLNIDTSFINRTNFNVFIKSFLILSYYKFISLYFIKKKNKYFLI